MKRAILVLMMCMVALPCFAEEYYVYIRLEDRAGVKVEDDVGRSKRGDVVDVRPINKTTHPNELALKEWMIFKADLTVAQVREMKKPWVEQIGIDENKNPIFETKAYRRNKIDTSLIGTKTGLISIKVAPAKIQLFEKSALDIARYERSRKIQLALLPLKRHWQFWVNVIDPSAFSSVACADDTTDGEQICTINKTGENYDTHVLWEDAKDGNLVTAGQIRIAETYNDDGDMAITGPEIDINGSTADATHYMKITVPDGERHNGTNNNMTTMVMTSSGDWHNGGIRLYDGFSVAEWLIIEVVIGAGHDQYGGITVGSGGNGSRISNNIIQKISGAKDHTHGISFDGTTVLEISNNIIYDFTGNFEYGILVADNTNNILLYNNTIVNCTRGIGEVAGKVVLKNNLAQSCTVSWYNTVMRASSTYNVSDVAPSDDDTTGVEADSGTTDDVSANKLIESGQNFLTTIVIGMVVLNTTDTTYSYVTTVDSNTQLTLNDDIMADEEAYTIYTNLIRTATFVNADSDDYHLDSTDTAAIDAGVDLSTTGNIDIDNRDRNAEADTWDIGADEYVSVAAGRRRMWIQ